LRGQDLVSSSSIEWQKALDAARNRKEALVMLFQFATEWNWTGQAEELVWTLVRNYPGEKWATVALTRTLLSEGRTRSLMALYNQQATANPSDLSARNNLAMTALLLNAWELRPHDLAREVYRKASKNPAYASTYALSLHLQDKNENALQVLQKLTPTQLEEPGVAACYGVVLQAAGHAEQARRYLDLASAGRLLPEERKLVWEARASAQSASFAHIAHGKS
jgi:thioredoxin-like negative regulator of GroEL